MASSSKSINMPLIFAVSIGAAVSLVAIVMFALAWYEYEARVVLNDQVIDAPTHDALYEQRAAEQRANLEGIESSVQHIVSENGPDQGHEHGESHAHSGEVH